MTARKLGVTDKEMKEICRLRAAIKRALAKRDPLDPEALKFAVDADARKAAQA